MQSDTLAKTTVLLVDDETDLVSFLEKLLNSEGFNVLTAQNGRQAVDLYESNADSIDLILMDITMPVMNGIEAYIKISERDPRVPILLMSAYSQESLNCLEYPHFIQKPMHPTQLFEAIRKTIEEYASCSK